MEIKYCFIKIIQDRKYFILFYFGLFWFVWFWLYFLFCFGFQGKGRLQFMNMFYYDGKCLRKSQDKQFIDNSFRKINLIKEIEDLFYEILKY